MPRQDIIVIGGSAGALEPLVEIVATLDPTLPAAVFVVLHTSSNSRSALPDILSRSTPLAVAFAEDGAPVEHGRIYIAVPDLHLTLGQGVIAVHDGPVENGFRPAVDPLFRSAARAYGPRVVGLILSGALDDGTFGLMAVKEAGGLAIVQHPYEALIPNMPLSAIQNVEVDHIVRVAEIPRLLSESARIGSRTTLPKPQATEISPARSLWKPRIPPSCRPPMGRRRTSPAWNAAARCGNCTKAASSASVVIKKTIRELCVFARQDLTRDPPFSKLDLILCRNVLIYLGPSVQSRLISVFHYALKSTGYLVLGSAETIGSHADLFAIADKKHRVYRKDLEAANEELQSANEEILSSNEELQSTNEELDTAKEELQSTNEELNTVNDELHGRNEELARINSDLVNLLNGVQIAIVIVASDLRIRRFTPMAERVLNLIPGDIGRPISQIKPNINVPDLESLITEVIDTITVQHRDVQDSNWRLYSLTIRPYKSVDNRIDGAVLALFDVDEVRRREHETQEAREFMETVINAIPAALLILGPDLRVRRVTQAAVRPVQPKSSERSASQPPPREKCRPWPQTVPVCA